MGSSLPWSIASRLASPETDRARDFVVNALKGMPFSAVITTKPDKYDRYLADLFYLAGEEDAEVVLKGGHF